eukprot:CAMPEP_0172834306 /NCGR_PEP_ID=MMETSP1075-20121228/24958_1 /TAXON_ID=2916 /ORGANISM="Ceratium fusus, Strain PA161109" /LENGTH=57 /DNA_ID=CAMNT_0013677189 /DNA_START=23 /DNA_END=192 /DNA_ORIENTATION=-
MHAVHYKGRWVDLPHHSRLELGLWLDLLISAHYAETRKNSQRREGVTSVAAAAAAAA